MQTLDAQAITIQEGSDFTYYRHVTLQRRFWNGSAYVLAADLNIDDKVLKCGNIKMALDVVLGTWKVSNLDITVKNNDNAFSLYESGNIFEGYEPELSQIQVEFGYLDGSTERGLFLFTGVITQNGLEERQDEAVVHMHVKGLLTVLDSYSAEDLPAINETAKALVNAGDDLNYTTSETGIGKFVRVFSDGAEKDPNDDYTISQLNDETLSGKITFLVSQAGKAITSDYIHWYQDKTFKFLVEALLDHAQITDYVVQDVSFPNNIEADFETDSQAEWNVGTFDNLTADVGGLSSLDVVFEIPTVNESNIALGAASSTTAIRLEKINIPESVTLDKIKAIFKNTDGSIRACTIYLVAEADIASMTTLYKDKLSISITANMANYEIFEQAWDSGATIAAGNYYVCYFGTSALSSTKRSNTSIYTGGSAYNGVWSNIHNNWDSGPTIWSGVDLYFQISFTNGKLFSMNPSKEGTWMSATHDMTAAVVGFGTITASTVTLNVELFTISKAADAGWPVTFDENDWDAATGGVINSSVLRYIRKATRVSISSAIGYFDPGYATSILLTYLLTEFTIKLANWDGLTVKQAIQEMATISNYQFGFRGFGQFVFKQKTGGDTPDFDLYGVTKVLTLKKDFSRVKTRVKTTFGEYSYLVDSITQGDASPTPIEKYGVQQLNITGGNLLNNNNVNVAKGSAETNYDDHSQLKWYCRITSKMIFQLELSDFLRLNKESTGLMICIFNSYIFNGYVFGGCGLPFDLIWRIVEITFKTEDISKGGMEFTLLEA